MSSCLTRIYAPSSRNLARLARLLRNGELVAVPSETVYGLAANALDPKACERIFTAKERPKSDPLIIHICDFAQLAQLAHAGPIAQKLTKAFWPGPLTLVLPKTDAVPSIVTARRGSVAMRMPQNPLFLALLKASALPLAAPSANPFGYVSPTTAAHVKAGLGGKIPAILDGGPCDIGLESTILDARDERHLAILRHGAINTAQLEDVAETSIQGPRSRIEDKSTGQVAPGMLSRHYSPRANVVLYDTIPDTLPAVLGPEAALLYFSQPSADQLNGFAHTTWLTTHNDQTEAAHTLFATLRELDEAGFKAIHAELAPNGPLSAAINDRLRRAAAR